MPIYEFSCNQCNAEFEELITGSQQPECPSCRGKKLTKKFSIISAPASGSSNPSKVCDPLPGGG